MYALFGFARRLVAIFRHRRDARILADADARLLADIGLNRADLRDAFSEPLWRDPTRVLQLRAGERRTHRPRSDVKATLLPDRKTIKFPPMERAARLHL
jgi:uncharacterized protein YjiS (DUF1127 family)